MISTYYHKAQVVLKFLILLSLGCFLLVVLRFLIPLSLGLLLRVYFDIQGISIETETITLPELKELKNIDKIEVYYSGDGTGDGKGYQLRIFQNPEEIEKIVDIFQQYADGWIRYHPVPPHGPVSITFHSQGTVQASIGISAHKDDRSYYLAQFIGYGRPLGKKDFDLIIYFLEIDEVFTVQ